VGGERAREHASERGRRDISGRGEQEENVCTARRPPRRSTVGLYLWVLFTLAPGPSAVSWV